MPIAPEDILAIEARMLRAWPALETEQIGGWQMRFANGYSKRANSVTPMTDGASLDDQQLQRIEQAYRTRGIKPTVRIFPFSDAALDNRLSERSYSLVDPTVAMLAALDKKYGIDPRVTFLPRVTDPWAAANASAYGGEKSNHDHLFAILSRIEQPAAFATLSDNGIDCAWGIAVADSGFVGLQDIVVSPQARGRKIGRALVQSLIAWGQTQKAARAYLHRLASNEPARALYAGLGFSDAYSLHYRVQK